MEHSKLSLLYIGPAVESGEMDAYEAGASIIAFGDYLGVVARAAYGENTKVKTNVHGVSRGSFSIEFSVQAAGIVATIFAGIANPKDLLDLIKQSIDAWKLLRGEPPKQFHIEGDKLMVENNYGTINYFRVEVAKIVTNENAGDAVGRFIKKNLEGGVDEVMITSEKILIADARKEDASSFVTISTELPFLETTITMGLVIESAVFKEGNMWKFSDGQTSFHAAIDDMEFLHRVNTGEERFGKGDILIVELEIKQLKTIGSLKTERRIKKVIEHRTFSQEKLF